MHTDLAQARLCQYVYTHEPDGEAKEIEYIIRDDLVVLRGSSKDLGQNGKVAYYQDWIRNIRFFPWYSKEIGWHPVGFLKAGIAIADRMESIAPTRFTGHSLGGIVAQIAAAVLASRGYLIKSVVVFGSPKCGKLPSLDNVDVRLYAANNDPVTKMAPWNDPIREVTQVNSEGHAISGYIKALSQETPE